MSAIHTLKGITVHRLWFGHGLVRKFLMEHRQTLFKWFCPISKTKSFSSHSKLFTTKQGFTSVLMWGSRACRLKKNEGPDIKFWGPCLHDNIIPLALRTRNIGLFDWHNEITMFNYMLLHVSLMAKKIINDKLKMERSWKVDDLWNIFMCPSIYAYT